MHLVRCLVLLAIAAPCLSFVAPISAGNLALRGGKRAASGAGSLEMAEGMKRVLVTGANKGIGLGIVEKLLAEHPNCQVLLGSRSQERGDAALKQVLQKKPDFEGRVEMLLIDTSSDDSVAKAAATVEGKFGKDAPLWGVINNAGIGFNNELLQTLQTNAYGPYRVNKAFIPLLEPKGGRIVNIASASGPMFVAGTEGNWRKVFTDPNVEWSDIEKVMQEALSGSFTGEAYGFSKACLNAYTRWLARTNPNLNINSCTPGFIATDLTKGMGASGTIEKGATVPVALCMGEAQGPGFYFGSDGVRSPLDRYRGPGDPPYKGD
mmetsp:Transcript_12358/g.30298  ORF Transcript_12358/g.30298 Transcript_12358/m.30298 type:complete len:321 (-) Transcript_12358:80-1042(-)